MKKLIKNNAWGITLAFVVCLFWMLPASAQIVDSDGDGLSDSDEAVLYFTNIYNSDTDGDGFSDSTEIQSDHSPHKNNNARLNENDYDGDGLNDWVELRWFQSSVGNVDSDMDTRTDFDEVMRGMSPTLTNTGTTTLFSRRIVVDRTNQKLDYLVDGIKIKSFPVSTGNPQTPTPAGEFSIQRKREYVDYIGRDYSYPHIRWNMQFIPHYYIHTATWHNDFGKRTRSHGCVNMRQSDAEILYKYVDVGVPVTVTGTTPARLFVGR